MAFSIVRVPSEDEERITSGMVTLEETLKVEAEIAVMAGWMGLPGREPKHDGSRR